MYNSVLSEPVWAVLGLEETTPAPAVEPLSVPETPDDFLVVGAVNSLRIDGSRGFATSTLAVKVSAGAKSTFQVAMMLPGSTLLGVGSIVIKPAW